MKGLFPPRFYLSVQSLLLCQLREGFVPKLSGQVMDVHQELSVEFGSYQRSQGLGCIKKCGACCNKPDI